LDMVFTTCRQQSLAADGMRYFPYGSAAVVDCTDNYWGG
jgi:hypothetical protein